MKEKILICLMAAFICVCAFCSCDSDTDDNKEFFKIGYDTCYTFVKSDFRFTGKVALVSWIKGKKCVEFEIISDYTSYPFADKLNSEYKWFDATNWPTSLQVGDEFEFQIEGFCPDKDYYESYFRDITRWWLKPTT